MTHVDPPRGFPPAAPATRAGRVAWVSIVLAVALVALGVLVLRDALVLAGRVSGDLWLPPLVDRADGVTPTTAVVVVGVVAALLGLWLVAVALGRRVRTRLDVRSSTGTTLSLRDAARLAASAAEDVDRVLSARASATRRSVTVTVTTLPGDDVADAVRAAVTERLAPLAQPLSVKVAGRVTAGLAVGGDGR
ncbi:DUF6286 domain-containing protein [Cellulomonas fengjieae]|uniref:DUF6286 domain-containing protein n=1 Tax=Cellulomonas fengjieae TaxID=2819978 RepID=A0ABS3SK96_9CELL|nr:DUF6286 domain-containing protein [Cellulomonas fengjieae]MBO3086171.1 hypothetical protein [Cellulomonas fengjieae]MBO3102425.1 hypothetical protein [Cellulomonas fengjieae]QVI65770.1 hypothetical protein KG102_17105 [Cellulomonas fengjieae]